MPCQHGCLLFFLCSPRSVVTQPSTTVYCILYVCRCHVAAAVEGKPEIWDECRRKHEGARIWWHIVTFSDDIEWVRCVNRPGLLHVVCDGNKDTRSAATWGRDDDGNWPGLGAVGEHMWFPYGVTGPFSGNWEIAWSFGPSAVDVPPAMYGYTVYSTDTCEVACALLGSLSLLTSNVISTPQSLYQHEVKVREEH